MARNQPIEYTPRKAGDMLSGVSLMRPASRLLGLSAREKVEWAVGVAKRDIAAADLHYAACRKELGKCNIARKFQRTAAKAGAFRMINRARKQMRDARNALTVALAAVENFDRQNSQP